MSITSPTAPRAVDLLADRSRRGGSSAIRDLLDHAKRPGMISLAGGLPDASRFPAAELEAIAGEVIRSDSEVALQYAATAGLPYARAAMARLVGSGVSPDEVVITTGSQQGIDLLARTLIDPGDAIVVADPEYLGTLQVLRSHRAHLVPMPVGFEGMDTELLAARLRSGLRPKACYLVPHFHNPTGASISRERRRHLDELASTYGFLIIEDDPYRDLYYNDSPPAEISANGHTVKLRSISKTLAPGLRVGAMSGPQWLLDAVTIAKQSTDLHTSSLSQLVAAHAIEAPWFPAHIASLRRHYGTKRDLLVQALGREFGDRVEFARPTGGMFLWARFRDIADTEALLRVALDRGVCFVPGSAFSVSRDYGDRARLSFVTASASEIDEACARLASAVAAVS